MINVSACCHVCNFGMQSMLPPLPPLECTHIDKSSNREIKGLGLRVFAPKSSENDAYIATDFMQEESTDLEDIFLLKNR